MTADQHNRYLGFAHLAYAALHLLMGVLFGVIMIVMFSTIPPQPGQPPPPPAILVVMACFFLVFTVGWTIPSMVAAYALLKRKRWAKTAGIVAGVFAGAQMPVGTAVCVYTFWFLFSEPGRSLYDRPTKTLPGGRPDWNGVNQQRSPEGEYAPTASPPHWR
ncbi:MAG TPA: hypothetical protein VGC60_16645 [Pyrinomonadaceae bacterium]